MRKTFEKYFIASVFILISGVFHLHANSIAEHEQNTALSQYCAALPHTTTTARILPQSSEFDLSFGQILLEEIELSEYDYTSENPDFAPDFKYLSLSAYIFNFYLKNWKFSQQLDNQLSRYIQPALNTHCKRYIELEVFRI